MPRAMFTAAVVAVLLLHFVVSLLLHTQILNRLRARHYELWVALGSLTPLEALRKASVPGLFQGSGAISYLGWLHLKTYRDIGDPDLTSSATRLRFLNVTTIIVLVLVLITGAINHLGRWSAV